MRRDRVAGTLLNTNCAAEVTVGTCKQLHVSGLRLLATDPALKQLNGMEEKRPQILRLTTPKLKNVWGPVRSG